jgi:hypothetical protein
MVFMLTIERAKQLLNDPNISDSEAMEIRDSLRALAEIIFEKWAKEQRQPARDTKSANTPPDPIRNSQKTSEIEL